VGTKWPRRLRRHQPYEGVIGVDLAEKMPETPDGTTFVVKIEPNIRFHDTDNAR
jgi:hypothetical protein